MRIILRAIIFTLSVLGLSAQRNVENINFDWKFAHGEHSLTKEVDFNDKKWQTVHLPHDASIAGPFVKDSLGSNRRNGFLPRRKGWYRKTLELNSDFSGKKVFLEFEGIYRDARIFLNGQEMAHQLNGFESFIVDITNGVKKGANTIAVSYDNTDMESSRWYNGEGIYRDVNLLVTSDVHVGYNGTFIYAPFISKEKAKLSIQTEVINQRDTSYDITLVSDIKSPSGEVIKSVKSVVPILSGELYTYKQELEINTPELWDLDNPLLYTVVSHVFVGKKKLDTYNTTFGIRTVEFNPEQGMLLNGQKVFVKGVNIHHDLGPLGAAAFQRGFERRLEGLKKLGCNAIRLSHNPHDKYILEWCDRNGMLVLDEAFDKWQGQFYGQGNNFDDHWEESLTAFVKRDRNHPSVFLWSVGNETNQQRSGRYDYGVPQLKKMVSFVHSLDPSRKVTCALFPSRKSGARRTKNYYSEGPPEMVFYMDVVSTNYREEFWPMDRKNYPQLTFILSEAQVSNLGNEWFNLDHEKSVGLFYWGGTDYIGESFGWPSKGWLNGIIDINDHWKPLSYYINSLYSDQPMVHITAYNQSKETEKYWNDVRLRFQPMFSHWNWKGYDSVTVMTFTNGQEVELFLNDKSLGVKKIPEVYYTKAVKGLTAEEYNPDNPILTGPAMHKELEWDIPYQPGSLKAVSKINGEVVAEHVLQTSGKPYAIKLDADRSKIKANGLDLSYITVSVVDKNGLIVPNADHLVHFDVIGAGYIAGVGSADLTSSESFVSNKRKVFQGKVLLVVRSERKAGKIVVIAKSKGLNSGKLIFSAE